MEWRPFQPQPGAIGFGELGGIVSEANNRYQRALQRRQRRNGRARGFDGAQAARPPTRTPTPPSWALWPANSAEPPKAIEIWNEQTCTMSGQQAARPAEYMNLSNPPTPASRPPARRYRISGALTPAGSNLPCGGRLVI